MFWLRMPGRRIWPFSDEEEPLRMRVTLAGTSVRVDSVNRCRPIVLLFFLSPGLFINGMLPLEENVRGGKIDF
jgi:hypothetical protein